MEDYGPETKLMSIEEPGNKRTDQYYGVLKILCGMTGKKYI